MTDRPGPAPRGPGLESRPMEPKSPAESIAVMTQIILPSDANPLKAAFGGRVLEWIDICGAIAAGRHCRHAVVTASMDDLHFHAAIRVGWVVTLRARVLAAFRSSMEVGVMVTAENPLTGEQHLTTSALAHLRRPQLRAEPGPGSAAAARDRRGARAFEAAHARRQARLERKGKRRRVDRSSSRRRGEGQVENDVPQPQVDLAFGFSNLKPAAVVPTT